MTALQKFFGLRPRLFLIWYSMWVLPLTALALIWWAVHLVLEFPRHLWIYGLRDWPSSTIKSWRNVTLVWRLYVLNFQQAFPPAEPLPPKTTIKE